MARVLGWAMERKGTLMRDSNKRVAARRAVLDAQAERRRVRQEREDQLMGLAVAVNVALATGRTALEKAELVAGQALEQMVGMGVSVAEVVEWCAGNITVKDVARLRQVAAAQPEAAAVEPRSSAGVG